MPRVEITKDGSRVVRGTADTLAIRMLLDNDQAGLTKLANKLSDLVHNRVECPECGDKGPHEDNGCSGADLSYLCRACCAQFDAQEN